jgi:cold shock protein
MEGTVKFFNIKKGFGFVKGDDEKDYFVHISAIGGIKFLREGDRVSFDSAEGERGLKAENVKLAEGQAPAQETTEEASTEEEQPAEEATEEAPAEEPAQEEAPVEEETPAEETTEEAPAEEPAQEEKPEEEAPAEETTEAPAEEEKKEE